MATTPVGDTGQPLLEITGLTKNYGATTALDAIDLVVRRGEFFALLGASGSGKSTFLQVLSGLLAPDAGQVLLDGQDMGPVAPHARPINMMFQSYALFPHMNVAANIGFGLKQEGRSRRDIRQAVTQILELVALAGFEHRSPASLSGGERQRVALARCLVKRPKLLLLDEPLAALDKRLREQTRHELVALQQKLGLTVIMVTHDQDEAMCLASRIAIMARGRLVQTGAARAIYRAPVSLEVAGFVGSINLLGGRLTDNQPGRILMQVPGFDNPVMLPEPEQPTEITYKIGTELTLALRPEQINLTTIAPRPSDNSGLATGTIETVSYLGHRSICQVRLENGALWQVPVSPAIAEHDLQAARAVWLTWCIGDVLVFAGAK